MTFHDDADSLTGLLRNFMASVREHAAKDGPDDPVDRILAAATLLVTATLLAWPSGRKLPRAAVAVLNIGRQLWARRAWWFTEPPRPGGVDLHKE